MVAEEDALNRAVNQVYVSKTINVFHMVAEQDALNQVANQVP
jgi:hypothetical protein